MSSFRIALICLSLFILNACGSGGGGYSSPPVDYPVISVALSSATPSILINQSAQMQVTVTGTTNLQVTYSVDGGSNNGTVDANGLYHAPDHAGSFTVRATSVADTNKSGVATVTVSLSTVSINPATSTIVTGTTIAFSANTTATFTVTGGAANGTILATGFSNANYTAPSTPGTYQVVATSAADVTMTATATITVIAPASMRVNASARIAPNTTTQFTAYIDDVQVSANWTIEGNCGTCSINSSGLFSAGSSNATVTIRATNPSNSTQSATTQLTVATEVILTLSAPSAPNISTADMLTFNANISPEGINRNVSWSTGPASGAGTIITVDYFSGFLPPLTPGAYTITATSVADASKTAVIPVQVSAAPGTVLVATAGAPSSMRYEHAVAAMPDGRILILGGQPDRQAYNPLLTTDLYNPASDNFSRGPDLTLQRRQPEAIAIDAERILVTGGEQDYQTSRNTAEILNLTTGSNTASANTMSALRINHKMLKLSTGPNTGKILVMGGFNGPAPYGLPQWLATKSVDLFNPASNTFSASSASMNSARGLFTATTLNDGRILIVGGYQPDPGIGTLASAEIYDPVAGTFSYTGAMTVARYGHTATLLSNGKVLIVGGDRNADTHSSAEIYDPASGSFSMLVSTLTVTRIHHAAASLADGRVVIFGGDSGDFIVRGTVEIFDPSTLNFTLFAKMITPRDRATATSITAGLKLGKVLVFGGGAVNAAEKAAELTP